MLCLILLLGSTTSLFGNQKLVIISPKQGEIWKSGKEREIKWRADLSITKVNILYLINDGIEEVGIIAEGFENNGSFSWKVPERHVLVRLIIKGYDVKGALQTKAISEPFEIAPMIACEARWISIREKTKVAEVDISDQRLRVYENGILIFESMLSTGRGESTPTGTFTVCNKGDSDGLKSAWSKRYRCWMPYWVGLGGVPKKPSGRYGIHGAPYTKTKKGRKFKSTPWGRPSSKGCIRQLKAEEFYDLAQIRMTVVIQK
jgi:hypothetical protein